MKQELPKVNFIFLRDDAQNITSVEVLNQNWKKFFQVGCSDVLKEHNGRYIKVWPTNMPNIDDETLDMAITHSLEILEDFLDFNMGLQKRALFTYIEVKENNKGIKAYSHMNLPTVMHKLMTLPRNEICPFIFLDEPVKIWAPKPTKPTEYDYSEYKYSKKDKIAFLRNMRKSYPDLFPEDQIELLPKEMRLEAESNRSQPVQKNDAPDIPLNTSRGERSFNFSGDDIVDQAKEDYNTNPVWLLDDSNDDLIEKQRNNYEDFGSDEPSEFKQMELDDYLIDYVEDDFFPMTDKVISKKQAVLNNGYDIISQEIGAIAYDLPALLRYKP